jgi:hypothetical protein
MILYQNVVNHYFSDKEERFVNVCEFRIPRSNIPRYEQHHESFMELQSANLVRVETYDVLFFERWTKYISPTRFLKHDVVNDVGHYMEALMSSDILLDTIAVRISKTKKDVVKMLELFVVEQQALGKTYMNDVECKKHFMYWCQQQQANHGHKQSAISTSKILGI